MTLFPNGGAAIVQALFDRHRDLAHGSDDQRRELTRLIAETFSARFGPRWGTKSTTAQHPQSKDALAFRRDDGGVDLWDWQNGATRLPQVQDGQPPSGPDGRVSATDPRPQHFIAVNPIDHLASGQPPVVPEPDRPGGGRDDGELIVRIRAAIDSAVKSAVTEAIAPLASELAAIKAVQARGLQIPTIGVAKPAPE